MRGVEDGSQEIEKKKIEILFSRLQTQFLISPSTLHVLMFAAHRVSEFLIYTAPLPDLPFWRDEFNIFYPNVHSVTVGWGKN